MTIGNPMAATPQKPEAPAKVVIPGVTEVWSLLGALVDNPKAVKKALNEISTVASTYATQVEAYCKMANDMSAVLNQDAARAAKAMQEAKEAEERAERVAKAHMKAEKEELQKYEKGLEVRENDIKLAEQASANSIETAQNAIKILEVQAQVSMERAAEAEADAQGILDALRQRAVEVTKLAQTPVG